MPLRKIAVIVGGGIQGFQLAHFLTLSEVGYDRRHGPDTSGSRKYPFQRLFVISNGLDRRGVTLLPVSHTRK